MYFCRAETATGYRTCSLTGEELQAGYQGLTVILWGMSALKPATIKSLVDNHLAEKAMVSVLTTIPPPPHAYGRIVKDDKGNVIKIVEHKDATETEKKSEK